ncbi:MAG: hypothetical protein IPK65_12340 [Gammaproteobacteria bacterium]|nr:hypothetical protein [Gammaproteobacteria bacterium]
MHRLYSSPSIVIFALVFAILILPREAAAVPAFSRQTGMACNLCHAQTFPSLNAFGRAFKADGYTMVGGQSLIEGDHLSIPMALNMSLIAKLRYDKTNGNTDTGSDQGQIQWPDEAAFLIGGKLADNVGFLVEAGLANIVVPVEVDTTTGEGEGSGISLLGSKIHFKAAQVGSNQISVIPFSTDGLGVGYGFELLNTGALRSQRPIENRTGFSAAQALETGSGPATGIAFVASSNNYFVNYTPWTPGFGGDNFDISPTGFAHYLRAASLRDIGSWDTGFGIQLWSGEANPADVNGVEQKLVTDAWVVDAQALGVAGSIPVSLYASYGSAKGDTDSLWNTSPDDAKAFALMGQVGVAPERINVYLAYRTLDNGAVEDNKFNATTFGGQYLIAQNIRMELFYVKESGSGVDTRTSDRNARTMFQLFAGF